MLGTERLRMGTRRLFAWLQEAGFEISIYTSSFRSHSEIRKIFKRHDIEIAQVVNGDDHQGVLAGTRASKRPECFGFDIHVDDESIGNPQMEDSGQVIIVDCQDTLWVEHIIKRIQQPVSQNR